MNHRYKSDSFCGVRISSSVNPCPSPLAHGLSDHSVIGVPAKCYRNELRNQWKSCRGFSFSWLSLELCPEKRLCKLKEGRENHGGGRGEKRKSVDAEERRVRKFNSSRAFCFCLSLYMFSTFQPWFTVQIYFKLVSHFLSLWASSTVCVSVCLCIEENLLIT